MITRRGKDPVGQRQKCLGAASVAHHPLAEPALTDSCASFWRSAGGVPAFRSSLLITVCESPSSFRRITPGTEQCSPIESQPYYCIRGENAMANTRLIQ